MSSGDLRSLRQITEGEKKEKRLGEGEAELRPDVLTHAMRRSHNKAPQRRLKKAAVVGGRRWVVVGGWGGSRGGKLISKDKSSQISRPAGLRTREQRGNKRRVQEKFHLWQKVKQVLGGGRGGRWGGQIGLMQLPTMLCKSCVLL